MDLAGARCVVRGSINIDEAFYVQSISRPGETISSRDYTRRIGGKGANQAVAIARAGGIVDFYGTIGKDGEWLKTELRNYGLNVDGIIVSEEPTGRALIQVADNGENSIVLFPGANRSQLHEQRFGHASDNHNFPDATHLLLQNEIHPRSTRYALEHAHGAITIFNPSPLPSPSQLSAFPWSLVNWLIVNEGEAEGLFRAMADQDSRTWSSTVEMLQLLSSLLSFRKTNIVCTLGARGVVAVLPSSDNPDTNVSLPFVTCIPAAALEMGVNDTTGAGDCFTGYFVQGLMGLRPNSKFRSGITEKDIEIVLRFAVQAAGMSVERPGAIDSIPYANEVEKRASRRGPK